MPKDKTVITFNEGSKAQPEAIRAWFYPGANWGEEFVYPKAKAVELAKVTKPAGSGSAVADVTVEVAKPEEAAVVAGAATGAGRWPFRPTGEIVEIAQVSPDYAASRSRLPRSRCSRPRISRPTRFPLRRVPCR